MENAFKKSMINIVSGIGGQLLILVLGLIVPRLILVNYGSEINGLTNTVNQIYSYVALIEAGIGQSAVVALYKATNNQRISHILSGAKRLYRTTAWFFLGCTILLSLILPLSIKSELSYVDFFLITLFAGIPSFISFYTTAHYAHLLTVEGKYYIQNNLNVTITSLSYVAKIVLANAQVNILILQATSCFISLFKSVFLYIYFRKKYSWIDKDAEPDKDSFKDRFGYLKTQIAWTVFSNTDVLAISLICGLKESSVYAVYNMVFLALYQLMSQLFSSTSFLLGHKYNAGIKEYTEIHDSFDCFFDMLVCATMSVCYILILPFIKLYTAGVTDINYIDPYLPLLFCIVQILTWMRYAAGNLTSLAGYAKHIGDISIIEAIINVVFTILLTFLYGARGALIATVIALLFKSNYLVIFINKKILDRSVFESYKILFSNALLFVVVVLIASWINIEIDSYITFFIWGIILSIVIYPLFLLMNLIVNKRPALYYMSIVKNKALLIIKRAKKEQ